ncbi:MAG: M20/M25/M40 family metallo-hydrolase [Clostridiales bacterium]|nr:M20/M25/M40 family metallo-hydrolase [Clostridiales bacterium]
MRCSSGERIYNEFTELTAIDSVSFCERQMADRLTEKLRTLGFEVREDDAGRHYNGNAGNLYGCLKGQLPGPPILLSAHMDTVQPGVGKQAVLKEDGRIESAGETVLGADDVCGIIEILEGIRCVREAGLLHRDIEVLFSIGEELHLRGSAVFDFSQVKAKEAYVLDMSGAVGSAALQAPTLATFQITVTGKAAHAGFEPERGIHAIRVMCGIIRRLRMGHLDKETVMNVGQIAGGGSTNIVPESCICRGEVRSFDHQKALRTLDDITRTAREAADEAGAGVSIDTEIQMETYKIEETDPVVRRFAAACRELEIPCELRRTFGGSDNNNFAKNGIHGIVLSCGMYQVHSKEEYTFPEDMVNGARLVAKLITAEMRRQEPSAEISVLQKTG